MTILSNGRRSNSRRLGAALAVKAPQDFRIRYTLAELEAVYDASNGVCAICGREELHGRKLSLDHDHATGKLRGLLCRSCNTAIGMLRDDPNVVRSAMAYLERHKQ